MIRSKLASALATIALGCGSSAGNGDGQTTTVQTSTDEGTGSETGEPGTADTGPDTKFDTMPDGDLGPPGPTCKVGDGMDAVPDCTEKAPPDSFEPAVQWVFEGDEDHDMAVSAPVVVNLTDDNDDGEIDLCDVPDVVVAMYGFSESLPGHLFVLDGESGALHFRIDEEIIPTSPPAVGDIDGDGLPEIVTAAADDQSFGKLIAFEHDGTFKWMGDTVFASQNKAVALADLDADGDVEIMMGGHVADHEGKGLFTIEQDIDILQLTTAADLDDDGDMEVIIGARAHHHDGGEYYAVPGIFSGHPQVANVDDDPEPEVIVSGGIGLSILEHDGTVKLLNEQPVAGNSWRRPVAVHDMDGDDEPEIAFGSDDSYSVLERDLGVVWTAPVTDSSGYASGTAFDFLGAGKAQAMYADEFELWVYDDQGQVLFQTKRTSWTQTENPVVADVDDDGSAEVVIVSNDGHKQEPMSPAVQLIRDEQDRWIQARRIWNQHTYHVTNVREDGTIPQDEPRHWELLNTFRTQAQIEGGGVCKPVPEG